MIFEDDVEEVTLTITIHFGDEIINVMKNFVVGNMIIIKCCMMFNSQNHLLFLTAENMKLINKVRIIVTQLISMTLHILTFHL
jgi:hypothetical protein